MRVDRGSEIVGRRGVVRWEYGVLGRRVEGDDDGYGILRVWVVMEAIEMEDLGCWSQM